MRHVLLAALIAASAVSGQAATIACPGPDRCKILSPSFDIAGVGGVGPNGPQSDSGTYFARVNITGITSLSAVSQETLSAYNLPTGFLDTSANASGDGFNWYDGSSHANITFYFAVVPRVTPPVSVISVPVTIAATLKADAGVAGDPGTSGLATADAGINADGHTYSLTHTSRLM